MTLTTPASASLPHSALWGPRTTSMRSTSQVVRSWKANSSLPAGSLASMPSMSTSTWLASAPRTRTWVWEPMPPARLTVRPGMSCSRSTAKTDCLASICSRSMTDTELPAATSGTGTRDAVTTSVSRISSARTMEVAAAAARNAERHSK